MNKKGEIEFKPIIYFIIGGVLFLTLVYSFLLPSGYLQKAGKFMGDYAGGIIGRINKENPTQIVDPDSTKQAFLDYKKELESYTVQCVPRNQRTLEGFKINVSEIPGKTVVWLYKIESRTWPKEDKALIIDNFEINKTICTQNLCENLQEGECKSNCRWSKFLWVFGGKCVETR